MNQQKLNSLVKECNRQIHCELLNQLNEFLNKNNITQTDFARFIGVSKGYMSQLVNSSSEHDHKISKIIYMALAMGKMPVLTFQDIPTYSHNSEFTDFNIDTLLSQDIEF